MSTYCVIQIAKLDPISWSAYFPFGTLGNVNFLSGFMGVGLVTVFVFATSNLLDSRLRFGLVGLFFIGLFVLYESDSTQGIVALVVGIASFMLVKSWFVNKPIFMISLFLFASGLVALVLGLFDKGPLRALIYQFTVLYRADYMHAGIGMLLNKPLTGVGIDSYDDWYRAERGIISAMRTSLNRTANSAHNISIDIAIMEKAENVYVIPSSFGWSDLGTWNSAYENIEKDYLGNAVASNNVVVIDATKCMINAPKDKLVVVQGLDDFIVVDTKDVLLICSKEKEQSIKEYVAEVKRNKGDQYI